MEPSFRASLIPHRKPHPEQLRPRGRLRIRNWSLRDKTLSLVLVISALPVALATALAFGQARHIMVRDAESLLAARAEQLTAQLDEFHRSHRGIAVRMARRSFVVRFLERGLQFDRAAIANMAELLGSFIGTETTVRAISVVAADGRVFWSTEEGTVGHEVGTDAHFKLTLRAAPGTSVISGILKTGPFARSVPQIAYASPIYGSGASALGAIMVFVRADSFGERVRSMDGRAGESSYAILRDEQGTIIARGGFARPVGPQDGVDAQARDRQMLSVTRRLEETPWSVMLVVPKDVAFASVHELLDRSVVAAGVMLSVALAFGLWLSRRVQRPLRSLAQAADALANGQTKARLPVTTADELGLLSHCFNEMAEAIEQGRTQLERRVIERTLELEQATEQLTAQKDELLQQKNALQTQQRELTSKNEQIARADRLKSEFLANMSHELRTPLNSVIGFSDLLLDEITDPRPRQYVTDVLGSGRHLLSLINDILDLSKIEAGHMRLDLAPRLPDDAVCDAYSVVRADAYRKKISLELVVTAEQAALADEGRLRQVLLNLMSNAIKFSPEGSRVEVGAEDTPGFVSFWVKNEGPGIEAELRTRLFEPFVQGESPLHKRYQGTGLGLAISKRIVERHGGTIAYTVSPEQATVFRFSIPAATKGDSPLVQSAESQVRGNAAGDGGAALTFTRRLLALSNSESVTAALAKSASAAGYKLMLVDSPYEACERLGGVGPDVVIVDCNCPDLRETLEILGHSPATGASPVVMVSHGATSHGELASWSSLVDAFMDSEALDAVGLAEAVERVCTPVDMAEGARGATILVVDDHDVNRELARAILSRYGYEVHLAQDGLEALQDARRLQPALVLMDLAMPRMDGFAVASELKRDPITCTIPVIALTALAMRADRDRALMAGIEAYITKPVDRHALLSVVSRFVRAN